MNIRSMTGFARVRQAVGEGELSITVKSVNHRGVDVQVHASPEFDEFEPAVRSAVKKHVGRGHVEVRLHWRGAGSEHGLTLDQARLKAYIRAYQQASSEYGLSGEFDLNSALRLPGIFEDGSEAAWPEGFRAVLEQGLENALEELNRFRKREGQELGQHILERYLAISQAVKQFEEIRSRALPALQARLQERLAELLRANVIDAQRLAQEVAILADRSDIGEEIVRLGIHAEQLRSLVESGAEIGKKLDFLLQEMNRETNTILSKTSGVGEIGLGITELALGVKADIEKIREQALNIE